MDYSKLTTMQLTAVANTFRQIDALMEDDLPPDFPQLLAEYLKMDDLERMQLQSEMSAKANFKAYAEAIGNEGMADALEKVAAEMAKMDAKQLKNVADGGIVKLTNIADDIK